MLILLPPREGKPEPRRRAKPVELCRGPEHDAIRVLGLSPGRAVDVRRNPQVAALPSAPAERVYGGVLYEALGLTTLDASSHHRSLARVAIVSSLYGVVRPGERIAPCRLGGGVSLPGLGGVASHWSGHLDPVIREMAGRGPVVDLRSSTYAVSWRPAPDLAPRVVTVRVLHEVNRKRQVASHFNKATKGRLVRRVLEEGRDARTPSAFAALLTHLAWQVELGTATKAGSRLDVLVSQH